MDANFLLNFRWHLGRVTFPFGLENTPEALKRASDELALYLDLPNDDADQSQAELEGDQSDAQNCYQWAYLKTLSPADFQLEVHSMAADDSFNMAMEGGLNDGDIDAAGAADGAGGNVFVLDAQINHLRSRGLLKPKQERIERFIALIVGFLDDGEENEEATFCFLSSGNSGALANKVIDWFERRFDCFVEPFESVPVTTLGLLATRWSILQPPGDPLDPNRTLSLTLAPPADSPVRGVDAITILVPLTSVVSSILDKKHNGSRHSMVDEDNIDANLTREGEEEDDDDNWDALDLVDDICSEMLGLDIHKLTLAEFKTPVVALSSDGYLELADITVILKVLEDIAEELILPLTNSPIS